MIRYYQWCVACNQRATRTAADNVCELCFAEILNDLDGGFRG